MSRCRQYKVLVSRVQDWWYVEIPELGITTQSRTFSQSESAARLAIVERIGEIGAPFDLAIELHSTFSRSSHEDWVNPAS